MNISPKSEIFYLRRETSENDTAIAFVIQQFYRTDALQPMIVEHFGRILDGVFIDHRTIPITSRRRVNLFGLRFKAAMVITDNDTMNHLTDYR